MEVGSKLEQQTVNYEDHGVDHDNGGDERFRLDIKGSRQPLVISYRRADLRKVTAARGGLHYQRLCVLNVSRVGSESLSARAIQRVAQRSTDKITATLCGLRIMIDSPHSYTVEEIKSLVVLFLQDLERELSAPARATTRQAAASSNARSTQLSRRSPRPRRVTRPSPAGN